MKHSAIDVNKSLKTRRKNAFSISEQEHNSLPMKGILTYFDHGLCIVVKGIA